SDALMAGREARGERWRFAQLSHELRVCRAAALVYMERYTITPPQSLPTRRWTADDSSYFGTTLAVGPTVNRELAAHLHQELSLKRDVRGSADLLDQYVLLARLVSAVGSAFHEARVAVADGLTLRLTA